MADGALLAAFVDGRSEEAFNEIVRQHIAMVYAVCRRQLRDAHHAEDVTQAVFILLARKAESLPSDVVLGGWLYRTAVYACSNARSLQRTRAYHENRVTPMNTSDDNPVSRMEMEELLDEGLMRLSKAQREVIVLRFFEEKTLSEVADARRQSLHATQKSLNAGMANLRRFLSQRGVTVSLGAVGVLLAAQSVKAVPAGLAGTVGAAALQGGHALSGPVAQLVARIANHAGHAKLLASLATAVLLAMLGMHFLPTAAATTPLRAAGSPPVAALAPPVDHTSDLAALQSTLRQANAALRAMDLPALGQLVAFRDPAQSADWQRMAPLFEADLALRRAAAAHFGPDAPRLTAIESFSDRLDQVLPTIDDQRAAWSIENDTAALHFSYRNDPRGAALFFVKVDGRWRIDATRSAEVALEGLNGRDARAPLRDLSVEEQARVLAKIDRLQRSLTDAAARINAGQLTDVDEARQELQLADAPAAGHAFFRFALRGDDDATLR